MTAILFVLGLGTLIAVGLLLGHFLYVKGRDDD